MKSPALTDDDLDELDRECTSKRRYNSERAAGQSADRQRARGCIDQLRIYGPCRFCQGYHLTKVSLETVADRKAERAAVAVPANSVIRR